jgi:protein gp37
MSGPSPIEWTDATWNPIGGCSIKSPGCAPCYAQKLAGTRLKHHPLYAGTTTLVKGKPVFNGHLTAAPEDHPVWTWPVRWRGAPFPRLLKCDPCPPPQAELPYQSGWPSLIFVGDMSDLYHEDRVRAVQDRAVEGIVFSRHIGQFLTKRPGVMLDHVYSLAVSARWLTLEHPLFRGRPGFAPEATFENAIIPRLWLGTSAERQREFNERWPDLRVLAQMGFVVFISYEPAIGPLVLPDDFLALGRRAQVIAGGMSGSDPTPAHPGWFRAVRDQCKAAGVPFLFKQWGEYAPFDGHAFLQPRALRGEGFRSRTFPDGERVGRVGKKAAGRTLDGITYDEFPEVCAA